MFRPGDEITVLPSGLSSKVKKIVTRDEDLDIAYPGDSITLTIEDEIDTSRGDMIVRKNNVPAVSNEFEAYICWMNEKDMELNKQYVSAAHHPNSTGFYGGSALPYECRFSDS